MTLGLLAWISIVRRRNKNIAHTSTSTKPRASSSTAAHQPRKPEPTHLTDSEQAQDQVNQTPSPKLSPPPAYSPRLMKSSSVSNKKSTPSLNVDIDCDTEPTLPSPIRSASFNPSAKTQSIGSRLSSRVSVGAKKLYALPSSRYSDRPRLELTHLTLIALG